MRDLGLDVDEAAVMYWGDGYDPATEQITEGPLSVEGTASRRNEALAVSCLFFSVYVRVFREAHPWG